MSPHLATASLHPASPHQIEAPRQTHIHFIPKGGWLSQSAHLPCCFYYDSHLSLPPSVICHHLTVETWGAMTLVFTVKGWRDTYSLLIPEGWHISLTAAEGLLICWRGSWPRRYGWITLKKCLHVWALITSQTSDLFLSQRTWEEIFLPERCSGVHKKSPNVTKC